MQNQEDEMIGKKPFTNQLCTWSTINQKSTNSIQRPFMAEKTNCIFQRPYIAEKRN